MSEPHGIGALLEHEASQVPTDIPGQMKSELQPPDSGRIHPFESNSDQDDIKSEASSEVTEQDTSKLFPPSRPHTPLGQDEAPTLGLSRVFIDDDPEYDVVTVHGIRDRLENVWKTKTGSFWLANPLFRNIQIQQLDYTYATDEKSNVFRVSGIEEEAKTLLQLFAQNRRNLPDTEVNRPILWICHDIGGSIVKQALIEAFKFNTNKVVGVADNEELDKARGQIARLSTTVIFLGCPHKTESIDVLEDQVHDLMILPGPDIKAGFIKKMKNLARQVDEINSRFLDSKLFSRLLVLNLFSLQQLQASEDQLNPTVGEDLIKNHIEDKTSSSGLMGTQGIASSTRRKSTCAIGDNINCKEDEVEDHRRRSGDEEVGLNQEKTISSVGLMKPETQPAASSLIELPVARASPFSRYTTCLHSTFESKSRWCLSEVDHAALVMGQEGADHSNDWVTQIASRIGSDHHSHYGLNPNPELNESQFALLSMTSPTRLRNIHTDPMAPQHPLFLNWIISHKNFKMFMQSAGPCTLWIRGSGEDGSRTCMISQYLYTWYEDNRGEWKDVESGNAFFFRFDKFDSRYNGIKSMLALFLSEITWRMSSWPEKAEACRQIFRSLEYYRSWSLPVLFNLFSGLRRCKDAEKITIFLSCFDHCQEDERNWFLRRVLDQQHHSDMNYRWVITTCGRDTVLSEHTSGIEVLSLGDCPVPLAGYAIDERGLCANGLGECLEEAILKRPVLSHLRKSLELVLAKCHRVPYVGYRVLEWVSNFGRGLSVAEIIAAVNRLHCAAPENFLSVFIMALPKYQRERALLIHRWIKYAMEPLSIEALGHALVASTDSSMSLLDIDDDQLFRDVTNMFAGTVVIDDRYLKFSHECFHATNLFDDDETENLSSIHGVLAQACLKYLMHAEVQQRYTKLSVDKHISPMLRKPLSIPGEDFLGYAVRFWAEHYRLCDSGGLIELAISFFRTGSIRNRWAEAHYLLSNPFTRLHRGYLSPLPLIASLGLEDVLAEQVEEEKHSKWFQQDIWLAITEATRNSHNNTVCKLLEMASSEKALDEARAGLQDAIVWVGSSGNTGALNPLLESIRLLDNFSWPPRVLCRAAALGLDSMISDLITANYDLNEQDEDTGQTAIQTAISWGQTGVVSLLLEAKSDGLDLNVRDNFGRNALLLSAERGQKDILQRLLRHEASISEKSTSRALAVETAVHAGEHEVLRELLEGGTDYGGEQMEEDTTTTAFLYAAENCRLRCFEALLENGGNHLLESMGENALYLLCGNAHVTDICCRLIEKGLKPWKTFGHKEAILHRAMRTGDKSLVGLLISKGCELNSFDDHGLRTPLAFAVTNCSLEMVRFLLEKGASVNYVPERAESPLFLAAYYASDTRIAKLLLKYNADITWERTSDRWTALHAAYDVPKFMKVVLETAANVNSIINNISNYGTALMMAAKWNMVDVLKLLLAHHPLPNLDLRFEHDEAGSDAGRTALALALDQENYDCSSLLLRAGAKLDDGQKDASLILQSVKLDGSESSCKMLEDFIFHGFKTNTISNTWNTALHGIGPTTPVRILQVLVDAGAPLDSKDDQGLTPLAIAVECGNIAAASYLISKGAQGNLQDPSFGSLLHLACRGPYSKYETSFELFELLINADADPRIPGPEPVRESLLHAVICMQVAYWTREKIVQYLISHNKVDVNASGGPFSYPILAAAHAGDNDILEYLIRHGAHIKLADSLGRNAVHYLAGFARRTVNQRLIRILANRGLDMAIPDRFGRTALHFAAGTDDLKVLELIIRKLPRDYDINMQDNDGWTPLMWACRSSNSSNIIQHLVEEHKAQVSPRSKDKQWSALRLAYLSGQEEVVRQKLQPLEDENGHDSLSCDLSVPSRGETDRSYCDSCFMYRIGKRYKCTVCEDFDLCFKCFPRRGEMHNVDHSLEEYQDGNFVDQDERHASSMSSIASTDDESDHGDDEYIGARVESNDNVAEVSEGNEVNLENSDSDSD